MRRGPRRSKTASSPGAPNCGEFRLDARPPQGYQPPSVGDVLQGAAADCNSAEATRAWFDSRVAHHLQISPDKIDALQGGFVNMSGEFYTLRSRFFPFRHRNRPPRKVVTVRHNSLAGSPRQAHCAGARAIPPPTEKPHHPGTTCGTMLFVIAAATRTGSPTSIATAWPCAKLPFIPTAPGHEPKSRSAAADPSPVTGGGPRNPAKPNVMRMGTGAPAVRVVRSNVHGGQQAIAWEYACQGCLKQSMIEPFQ